MVAFIKSILIMFTLVSIRANPGLGDFWKFNPDVGYLFGTYMEFVKSQIPTKNLVHFTFKFFKHLSPDLGYFLIS